MHGAADPNPLTECKPADFMGILSHRQVLCQQRGELDRMRSLRKLRCVKEPPCSPATHRRTVTPSELGASSSSHEHSTEPAHPPVVGHVDRSSPMKYTRTGNITSPPTSPGGTSLRLSTRLDRIHRNAQSAIPIARKARPLQPTRWRGPPLQLPAPATLRPAHDDACVGPRDTPTRCRMV